MSVYGLILLEERLILLASESRFHPWEFINLTQQYLQSAKYCSPKKFNIFLLVILILH